jgi:cytidylate kinase
MSLPKTIAIDGPAASGKSTLGKRLADEFGYLFFDTGVMYRAVTWLALRGDTEVHDEAAVTALAEQSTIDIRPPTQADGRNCDILADGEDITWQIRRPEVDANVSLVSSYRGVRQALSAQQRRIGLRGGVVMVGRDIGTVVLPEAELKIYLEASAEERARRRYLEVVGRGEQADYEVILSSIRMRDQIDSTRALSPLRPAEDAVRIDSNDMDVEKVEEIVMQLVKTYQEAAGFK